MGTPIATIKPTDQVENAKIAVTVSGAPSNNFTIALKTGSDADPSSDDSVFVAFNDTANNTYAVRTVSSALSVTFPDASLGLGGSEVAYVYVYLIDNSGTVEIGVSATQYEDNSIQDITLADGTSDNFVPLYGNSALSDVAIRYLGYMEISKSSGYWQTPSLISTTPHKTYQVVSGIIQQQAGLWKLLNTGNHRSMGINTITDGASSVIINFGQTAKRVVALNITSDETYAENGVIGGVSLGQSTATVRFGMAALDMSGYVQYTGSSWSVTNATSNLAVSTFTSGDLILSHDNCTNTSLHVTPADPTYKYCVKEMDTTTSTINMYHADNTLSTSADTSMKFYFSRSSHGRGFCSATSDDISGIAGNFFFIGLLET